MFERQTAVWLPSRQLQTGFFLTFKLTLSQCSNNSLNVRVNVLGSFSSVITCGKSSVRGDGMYFLE